MGGYAQSLTAQGAAGEVVGEGARGMWAVEGAERERAEIGCAAYGEVRRGTRGINRIDKCTVGFYIAEDKYKNFTA